MANDAGERLLTRGAVLLGIGLGGFLDGIVLHQILQWHQMFTSVRPPDSMANMRYSMRGDGWVFAGLWASTVLGVLELWRARGAAEGPLGGASRSGSWFWGTVLAGWGLFNLVEGLVDHHLLGIHHVRGHPDPLWDWGFVLVGGVGLLALGLALRSAGRAATRIR